jgi:hypothetical protein
MPPQRCVDCFVTHSSFQLTEIFLIPRATPARSFDRRPSMRRHSSSRLLRESAHVRARRCALMAKSDTSGESCGGSQAAIRKRSGHRSRFVYRTSRKLLGKHARQCALVRYGASYPGCKLDRDIQAQSLGVANQIALPAIVHTDVEIVMRVALAGLVGSRDATLRFSTIDRATVHQLFDSTFALGSAILESETAVIFDEVGKTLDKVDNPFSISGRTGAQQYAGAAKNATRTGNSRSIGPPGTDAGASTRGRASLKRAPWSNLRARFRGRRMSDGAARNKCPACPAP